MKARICDTLILDFLYSFLEQGHEVPEMNVSYKKLWKLLIDKDMMKKDLQKEAGISWATLTKMSKGEVVSTEVLMKVCKVLHCDVGDIVEFIDDGSENTDKEK